MRYVFVVFVLLMILSCKDSITPADPIIDDPARPDTIRGINNDLALIPLTKDNYWKYAWLEYDPYGPDTVISSGQFKWEITDELLLQDSIDYYYVHPMSVSYPPLWEPEDYRLLYFNSEVGTCLFGGISSTDTLADKVLLFKYPVVAGESWKSQHIAYDLVDLYFIYEEEITVTCIATDSILVTPLGEFSCYVYHYRYRLAPDIYNRWNVYKFFVPGIGEVGQVTYGHWNELRKLSYIISEYNLN